MSERATHTDDRAPTVLVAGTASHVGKSTVVAGLCRRLADRGLSVAPFKAQNMSNNARVGVTPDGDWGELGVSQYVQARAARTAPSTDHNPVLLKPRGDGESQLVVDGQAVGHYEAGEYYDEHWDRVREAAEAAHGRLAREHDVVVAEGAGSIAEINLHDRDLANVETARFADATVLLVGDVERGGVFASLYGTLELMPADCRERVGGLAISKFRGDRSILDAGVDELEERTGVPVLDVLPHDDPGLPEEDSLGLPGDAAGDGRGPPVVGDDDGVPADRSATVGVVRLPHVSNFTDFEPLARTPGCRVAYLDPDAAATGGLDDVDAVVLPGTKNTVDDLRALRDAGVGDALDAFDGPVLGVCGGYQMLGERITNASVESTDDDLTASTTESGARTDDVVAGFGLLPVETRFSRDKRVESVIVDATGGGPLASLDEAASGYEIHMGATDALADVERPFGAASAATDDALGTYLHGLFENDGVREAFLDAAYRAAGRERPEGDRESSNPYDAAADLVAGLDPAAPDADWLGDPLADARNDE